MPPFLFTYPVVSPNGNPTPTQARMDTRKAITQSVLRGSGDPSATITSLRFFTDAGKHMLIVEGTTDDMDSLKEAAGVAENDLSSFFGWVTDGGPAFPDVAPDAAADPEEQDEAPAGGRRRRSSSKRVRKVTRRRRHRKSSRKLLSKLL